MGNYGPLRIWYLSIPLNGLFQKILSSMYALITLTYILLLEGILVLNTYISIVGTHLWNVRWWIRRRYQRVWRRLPRPPLSWWGYLAEWRRLNTGQLQRPGNQRDKTQVFPEYKHWKWSLISHSKFQNPWCTCMLLLIHTTCTTYLLINRCAILDTAQLKVPLLCTHQNRTRWGLVWGRAWDKWPPVMPTVPVHRPAPGSAVATLPTLFWEGGYCIHR